MICTRTLFFSPTRPCASANIDTLRCPKIEILKIGSWVRLVRLVQSFFTFLITCVNQESLLLLTEKKNEEATIATQQFGDASVWIKAYISFVYSLAAYCSSLIDLNCPIFYYFLFSFFWPHFRWLTIDAQVFSSCFQIHHGYFKESNQKADRKCEDERNEMEVNDRKTHWVKPFLVHLEFNVIGFLYFLL